MARPKTNPKANVTKRPPPPRPTKVNGRNDWKGLALDLDRRHKEALDRLATANDATNNWMKAAKSAHNAHDAAAKEIADLKDRLSEADKSLESYRKQFADMTFKIENLRERAMKSEARAEAFGDAILKLGKGLGK